MGAPRWSLQLIAGKSLMTDMGDFGGRLEYVCESMCEHVCEHVVSTHICLM